MASKHKGMEHYLLVHWLDCFVNAPYVHLHHLSELANPGSISLLVTTLRKRLYFKDKDNDRNRKNSQYQEKYTSW